MKKTWKWPPVFLAALSVFSLYSCQDWGQMDPTPGTDVYARTVLVAEYDFEDDLDPTVIQTFAYSGGDTPDLVQDSDLGSQVLHFNGGYVRMSNPMLSSSAQEAVSLTFWVKQAVADEDDLDSALFCFQNANGTQSLYLTGNGGLVYDAADGSCSVNTSDEAVTGMLDGQGEWHWVAVIIHNDGYTVYVDNNKRIDQYITGFDCSKMVQFMANTAYLYLGYGAGQNGEWWIDDLSIYRNTATSSQIAMPGSGSSSNLSGINFFLTVEAGYLDIRSVGFCPFIENGGSYTVGSTDNSTGWWSSFSDYVTMSGNNTLHWRFTNHTDAVNNWDNWLLVCTTPYERDADGYSEYFVLRADAYGWGDGNYDGSTVASDFDWNTFASEMDGAEVDLALTRNGNTVSMVAVITAESGNVYNYTFSYTGELEDDINFFLTCEAAHLTFDAEDVVIGDTYDEGTYIVGSTDLTTGWWSAFSGYSTVQDTPYPFTYVFYNYTDAANSWDNYVVVCTTPYERDADGYSEYFVLRADAYGWGDGNYNGDNISNSYNFDTFNSDMNGAYCRLFFIRDNDRIDMTARVRTAAGTELGEYTFYYEGLQ